MVIIKFDAVKLIHTLSYRGQIYERNHHGSWWLNTGGDERHWMYEFFDRILLESEFKKSKPIREVKLNRILNDK